jgi:hypothetical protein
MIKKWFYGTSLCLYLFVVSGCNSAPDNIAPASGIVTLDGKPVAEARVMFYPVGGARSSHATTNDKGEFKVSTFGVHDGALVGRHLVTVTKIDTAAQVKVDPAEGYMGAGYGAMMSPEALKKNAKPKQTLPAKYATKESSGIEVEIVKGQTNNFPLNLESAAK